MQLISATWLSLLFLFTSQLVFNDQPAVRDVQLSQNLFVTKLIPLKGKLKGKRQGFTAELRDTYRVTKYVGDSVYVELDWTLCPDGHCPEFGLFKEGTAGYQMIDSLIPLNPIKHI